MNRTIYIGEDIYNPLFQFSSESIVSASINTSVDLLQAELQVDTAEVSVLYNDENDELKNLAWSTPLIVYYDDGTSHKFYTTRVKRVGPNQYDLTAVSYIGFLDNEMFYGGVYDGVPLPDVISTIVRTDGLRTFNAIKSLKIDRTDSDGQMGGAVGVTWFDNDGTTNDMRNSMYLRFKVHGFHNDIYTYDGVSTTWWCPLVGQAAAPNASSTAKDKQYCVIGIWRRSSADEPFPETTELFFRYGQQEISMGTPNVGDIIEVDCNPSSGIVSINGVQHSITPKSSKVLTSLEVFGGGRLELVSGTFAYNHHVNLEWLDYRVSDYRNGNVLLEFLPLLNTRSNVVYYRNGLNGGQLPIVCSDPDNVEFDDDIEGPGLFPHEFRKDFADSISFSPEAKNYRVYGHIPICTKREAIHQILMPSGLSLKKDADGNWLFSETPTTIVADIQTTNVFEGGTIEYSGDVNEIVLKEHLFDASNALTKEIFSVNEETAEPFIAEFSEKPVKITDYLYFYNNKSYHALAFIYAWTENAALIPGNLLKIEGYPYDHQEKIYTVQTESGTGSTISVEDVTTITPENSDRMLKRLENYYLKSHTCKFDIVHEFEKCGLKYSFKNPFYEPDNGYLVSCGEQFSSFSRAQCEFLCGFDPIPLENGYSNYVLLTGSGEWEVPESVFEKDIPKIRVILIGGGDGGFSGCAGETGQTVTANVFPSTYAEGGEAGDPGAGGKVLDFTVVNPAATYTYSSGTGGSGADISSDHENHNVGTPGTESTISDGVITYTSDDGESLPNGHINFLTGEKYAYQFKLPGWKEIRKLPDSEFTPAITRFGYGAAGGYFTDNTKYSYFMNHGGSAYLMHKATSLEELQYHVNYWDEGSFGNPYPSNAGFQDHFQKGGGCGGGGAVGEDGQNGTAATSSKAGNGGRGGNATWIPPKATDYNPLYYGYGGHGGCGGGGGGASGYLSSGTRGTGGIGGYGGRSGDGGDGCILIYY